jgi:hypothetical protein
VLRVRIGGRLPPRWGRLARMEPVTLIVTALAAGTASARYDGTPVAVKDAYVRVKVPVKKLFANHPDRELVLARHERAPQT